jgi:LDH2 family malate/lactate/ureidoglycolate dehydrogenase
MKGGTLLPFGGYKGYGLAMLVETLAAVTSGAAIAKDVHAWNSNPEKGGNTGHFFMALDLNKLGNADEFKDKVDGLIDQIKSAKKAKGVEKIYFPGEIESEKMKKCLESGYVEILDDTMQAIARVEKELFLD